MIYTFIVFGGCLDARLKKRETEQKKNQIEFNLIILQIGRLEVKHPNYKKQLLKMKITNLICALGFLFNPTAGLVNLHEKGPKSIEGK